MTSRLPPLLATLLVVGAASAAAEEPCCGYFQDSTVGAKETALLTKALATDALYGEGVTQRVCFTEIVSLKQQVVAGTNYKFDVTACDVQTAQQGEGKCPSAVVASCAPREYEITVFEQLWTDTVRVSAITVATATNSSGSGGNGSSNDVTKNPSGVPTPAPTTKGGAVGVTVGSIAILTVAFVSAWL